MNRRTPLILSVILLVFGCSSEPSVDVAALQQEIDVLRAQVGPPPASLDRLYPPEAEAPVYQIKMHELGAPLSGLVVDLMEEDFENVPGQFAAFKSVYQEVAALVPEWENLFPMSPVDDLGRALEQNDPNIVMAALGEIGAVCHDCHVSFMPKVQQRYQWPSFSEVRATDPVAEAEVTMPEYMQAMEMSFSAVMTSLQQGQMERARGYFQDFSYRFGGLADLCINCHDTEREYFIDADVQRLVANLGSAIETASPDMARIGGLAQRIGTESCFRCHLVHVPAALAQAGWGVAH